MTVSVAMSPGLGKLGTEYSSKYLLCGWDVVWCYWLVELNGFWLGFDWFEGEMV